VIRSDEIVRELGIFLEPPGQVDPELDLNFAEEVKKRLFA
jgi:hypothetical protein